MPHQPSPKVQIPTPALAPAKGGPQVLKSILKQPKKAKVWTPIATWRGRLSLIEPLTDFWYFWWSSSLILYALWILITNVQGMIGSVTNPILFKGATTFRGISNPFWAEINVVLFKHLQSWPLRNQTVRLVPWSMVIRKVGRKEQTNLRIFWGFWDACATTTMWHMQTAKEPPLLKWY